MNASFLVSKNHPKLLSSFFFSKAKRDKIPQIIQFYANRACECVFTLPLTDLLQFCSRAVTQLNARWLLLTSQADSILMGACNQQMDQTDEATYRFNGFLWADSWVDVEWLRFHRLSTLELVYEAFNYECTQSFSTDSNCKSCNGCTIVEQIQSR